MNTPRLCNLRSVLPQPVVFLLAGCLGLVPLSARGQFATLLDTTARYAGNSTGTQGFNQDTGVATATELNIPSYIVFDSLGNLYISDTQNNCVRKVDNSGNITTVAGLRISGNPSDTCDTSTNNAPTPVQGLLSPTGLAIDSSNTLYIADSQHNCVRSLASGVVDSFASPALTTVAGTCSSVHTGSNTPLPDGLALDSSSNLYISIVDSLYIQAINQVVRHLSTDPATTICAVAGQLSPNAANTLCTGITGTVPTLDRPSGLAFDMNGNLFIADSNNNCVREIAGMTTAQTVVGQCTNDLTGSTSTALNNPYGLAFSSNASLYISEAATSPSHNNVVSYNFGSNTLALIAGLASGASGPYNASQDGESALLVPLNQPSGVTTDAGGNIYLADSLNNVVRKMGTNLYFPNTNVGATSPNQTVVFSINQTVNLSVSLGTDYNLVSTSCNGLLTTAVVTCSVTINFSPTRPGYRYSPLKLRDSISGKLISVQLDGIGIGPLSLLSPGVASTVTHATGLRTALAVSTDTAGDVYVLEQGNGSSTADVLFFPVGGGAAQVVVAQGAGMVTPTAMAVDGAGNIFIADAGVAGGSIIRFGADGSVNTSYATGLPGVNSMAVDGFDDLFLAIGGSFHDITEIYAGGQRRSVAGNGTVVDANGLVASTALFSGPSAIALGPNGIAVADATTHYVYLIDNSGIIHIVAGNGTTTTTSAGTATATGLVMPDGLAIDAAGDIYIADDTANIVYAVFSIISNGTNINPVIGTGIGGYTGDNGPSTNATINAPLAIALDGSSDLFVVDSGNKVLREVSYPVTSTIDFGNVLIGTTSPAMLQYLANAGNASLDFNLPFTTTATPPYTALAVAPTTCTANAGVMAAGGVCDIAYTFHPTIAGPVAGQSNLPTNSYNTPQTVFFNGENGYSTTLLPFVLNSETEVYGYPFTESITLNNTLPATGSMVFYIGSQTLCTTSITNASAGTITCNAAESGLAVGTYTVSFTFTSSNTFYSTTTGTTTLVITKAPLVVTPNNFSRQYGTANPTLTGTNTGEVNGDVFNVTYSTTATITSPVGTYPITASLTPVGSASLSNYTLTNNTGTLTVTQAGSGGSGGLVVTVNCTTRPYGQVNPTFTGTLTGALNGDTFTVTYSTTATQFSPVGNYTINAIVTGANIGNYVVTVNTCTLAVTPAGTGGTTGLTVNVNSFSRPYGTANPTFTGTVTGLLNGDTVTVTYSTAATIASPVGTYPITATVSGAAATNYIVTVNPGTLTITRATASLVVTVNNASRPYGAANPAFTSTITGALIGDTFTITYSTTATPASPVGTYPINATVSGATTGNYNITVVPGTLTVTPTAPLVVTVNNVSRPYGQPNPTFTSTIAGAVNGDTFTVTYSTPAGQFSPVGAYPINATVSGANIGNYSVTVNPGTLTITPAGTGGTAGLLVTVNNASRPYGTANPNFTSTVTGLLNGDTVTVTYSTAATISSSVGTYAINATVSGPAAANYTVTVIPGTLTITTASAQLVVTVFNASRPYATSNPTFTSTISGALNGDTFTITYSTPATITSPVGAYPINATVSGPAAANYNVIVDPGTLSVTTAINPLVITVNNASRPYATANPTFTGSISGLLNGDSVIVAFATPATPASPVGTYPINAIVSGGAASNYTITVVPGTLTITTATVPLVVTVNSVSRPYNTPNPTFTSTVTGLLNGDTVTVNYSTTATIASPVGTYPINATVSGPAAANYNLIVNPGILTITPTGTPLVVTVNNASRPYGAANPAFTSSISGALNGDTFTVTYSTAATIASPVGTYPINATLTGANIANYSVTVVPGVLTIAPPATATVVTTSASPVPQGTSVTFTALVTYGASLPVSPPGNVNFYNGATLLGTGALNAFGIATYTTSTLPAGSLTITATYQATPIYASSSGTVLQVITSGSFTVAAIPPNQFIRGAGSTTYAITVTSMQAFAGPVSLTCSGLPVDASCSFSTPTVTLTAGGSANTTLTVVNTEADARLARPALPIAPGSKPAGLSPIAFAAAFPFGLGAFLVGLARRRRGALPGRARANQPPCIRLLLVLLCAAGIISLAGCACLTSIYQVYTIPITATSSVTGASTQTASVTLTVAQQ
jgi:sugar lactone lactonase YvrE